MSERGFLFDEREMWDDFALMAPKRLPMVNPAKVWNSNPAPLFDGIGYDEI